jgi:TRAP-type C4-dicarboxylate transport system substrate-binding protein
MRIFGGMSGALLALTFVWSTHAVAQQLPKHHFRGIASYSSSPVYKSVAKPFWAEIEKDSKGQITADVLTNDKLGLKGGEVFRTMKNGLFDYTTNVISHAAGDDPRNEALDLAGIAQTIPDVHNMADAYEPTLAAFFKKRYNLEVLEVWPIGPVVAWCNAPVTSVADLKGKKVRAFNRTMADFLKGVGAVPVSMSFGDMVTGLQRGTVDCAITSPHSGLKAGLGEVTTHLLKLALGWAFVADAWSSKTWNGLDKPTQEFLSSHYATLNKKIYADVNEQTEDSYRCLAGAKPCNSPGPMRKPLVVTDLSAKDKATVAEVVKKDVLPAWAKRCGADCVAEWNKTVGKSLGITLKP